MQKLFLFIVLLNCFNAVAQDEDPIEYDPNLTGEWEVYSYIKVKYDGTPNDTIDIDPNSPYLNLTLIIQPDSVQELWMPANKSEVVQGTSKKWKLTLDKEGDRFWVEGFEVLFLSEKELHLLDSHDRGPFIMRFRRIDANEK